MTSAPKPEVLYLPAIFRSIRAGRIRIPAFQRGYVWRFDQLLSLLDSVRKSYPIGSLLFWRADITSMQTDRSNDLPIPHPAVEGEVDFVLDGMQRISSLYGAFHRRDGVSDEKDWFAVVYNLRTRSFLPFKDSSKDCINLRSLFEPRSLLAEQARLGKLSKGDKLVDESLELQHTFQEYLVPVVGIGEHNPKNVVEIFERVNSTGTRLSAVDFMRALTWSQSFDLTGHLQELSKTKSLRGFEVPHETLAKCIAMTAGIVPKSDEMIRLREKPSRELQKAVRETARALGSVGNFLTEKLGIGSYDFIPYEGQFLVLVSAASGVGRGNPVPEWLAQWYWCSGFSEFFFGRPDQTISNDAVAVKENPHVRVDLHFSLTVEKLKLREMRKGAALATTVLVAIATGPARSVVTGKPLDPKEFLGGYDRRYFGTVFSLEELSAAVHPAPATEKLICNVVLLDDSERKTSGQPAELRKAVLELGTTLQGRKALQTQCIDDDCLAALRNDDASKFLEARAMALIKRARKLSGSA